MIRISRLVGVLALLLLSSAPAASSQGGRPVASEGYLEFELIPQTTFLPVSIVGETAGPRGAAIGPDAIFDFLIRDISVERTVSAQQLFHKVRFEAEWVVGGEPVDGAWNWIEPDSILSIASGQTIQRTLTVQHLPTVRTNFTAVNVTANMSYVGGPEDYVEHTYTFHVYVYPTPGVLVQVLYAPPHQAPFQARPNTWVSIPFSIVNGDLYLQHVEVSVLIEPTQAVRPDQIPVIAPPPIILAPLETQIHEIRFRTPKGETYYGSESLQYTITVRNLERDAIFSSTSGVLIVQGFYFSAPLLIGSPLLLALIGAVIFSLVAGRHYYDERILGKPVAPWRIPKEAARLDHLRKENPREFYLERHFLMKDEYRSALNWFYFYKARTKSHLKHEAESQKLKDKAQRLVQPSLKRFDRRAERIKRKYHRKQERARGKLENRIDKLEGKLERHYQEDYEKDHEKWKKQVEKIQKRANRPWFQEHQRWEREAERILEEWEKPFAEEKAKHEKALAKARAEYESRVKKQDRQAWKDWKEAVENARSENQLRKKEGREPIPLPQLVSQAVGPAQLPPAFKEPPKPKFPPEPAAPEIPLPSEPMPEKPKLEDSHYARKARRFGKKTERKTRRLQRKLDRLLARNERHRVSAIAKADLKRNRLLRKSQRVLQPTRLQRLLRLTPEDKDRRAHRNLLRAQARERLQAVEEQERTRLEVSEVDGKRREAELLAKLIRERGDVPKAAGPGRRKSDLSAAERGKQELETLRATDAQRIAQERAAALSRIEAEKEKIQKELMAQLAQEEAQNRQPKASPEPMTPKPARRAKPSGK